MKRLAPIRWIAVAAAALLLPVFAAGAAEEDAIDLEIRLAIGTQGIHGQARTLARLAWGEENDNHELAARARDRLVLFGQHGMQALEEALQWAEPVKGADIMLAVIEAERQMTSGTSSYATGAVDYGIWFGTPETRRLAMLHLSARPIPILLLPVIDAAYEYPQLTPVVIETLELIGDDRARFFLAEQMEHGDADVRRRAAEAMAGIGGQCFQYLRAWTLSEQPEMREIALRAMLPNTTIGDLMTLYEYVEMFPDDDPNLLTALRNRALILEEAFERQQQIDSASPRLDD